MASVHARQASVDETVRHAKTVSGEIPGLATARAATVIWMVRDASPMATFVIHSGCAYFLKYARRKIIYISRLAHKV